MPPAPDRTDIYDKMSRALKLPAGRLSTLADLQRKDDLKRSLSARPRAPVQGGARIDPPEVRTRRTDAGPRDLREAALRRARAPRHAEAAGRRQEVAKQELDNDNWLHRVARSAGRSYEHMRVIVLEFLDTDVFNLSVENCVSFLDPLIESWDIDLATFGMRDRAEPAGWPLATPRSSSSSRGRRSQPLEDEPGFKEFLRRPAAERRCRAGGNRVPARSAVQAKTPDRALLLPGAAEPQGPAPFPRTGRGPRRPGDLRSALQRPLARPASRATWATSSAGGTGLQRWSWNPAETDFCRSSSRAYALTATPARGRRSPRGAVAASASARSRRRPACRCRSPARPAPPRGSPRARHPTAPAPLTRAP